MPRPGRGADQVRADVTDGGADNRGLSEAHILCALCCSHFCSRDAANIDGLGRARVEDLIEVLFLP